MKFFNNNNNNVSSEIYSALSSLLSDNEKERASLNRNRLKGDEDCGICEEIMLLRGRAEGIILVENILRSKGIL